MWGWLATLPIGWQVGLTIIAMLFVVVISIRGNAVIKWGKNKIGLGIPKNSCSQCRQLIMARTIKYQNEYYIIKDSILRDQMNYVEQKVHEIFLYYVGIYRDHLLKHRKEGEPIDFCREQREYTMHQEIMNNALGLVKSEIRRSFKENGFCEMTPVEYSEYCKEKAKTLTTISQDHFMSQYPVDGMIVSISEMFKYINAEDITSKVFSVFNRAKEIVLDAEAKIEKLSKEYDESILKIGSEDI